MKDHPVLLAGTLVLVVSLIWAAQGAPRFAFLFRRLPVPFYCYFIPTCLTAIGLLPPSHALYGSAARFLTPPCLILLLLNADLPALFRLGRPALGAMALGLTGIVVGMVTAHGIAAAWLPPGAWASAGALAGSWTGGSANMIAVKEALAIPERVFAPVIVLDTLFAYGWMAFLIWSAGYQSRFDAWSRGSIADRPLGVPAAGRRTGWPWATVPLAAIGGGAVALAVGAWAGPGLTRGLAVVSPAFASTFKPATWTVLAATTFGLGLSLSGKFAARADRTERTGSFLLYFLLTTLGAQASLGDLGRFPAFLILGGVTLAVHGFILILGARLFRLPLFLVATASQACVGGVVSAPMVAAVFRPALSAVGLLLAVLGNVGGTYLGVLTAQMCLLLGGRS